MEIECKGVLERDSKLGEEERGEWGVLSGEDVV